MRKDSDRDFRRGLNLVLNPKRLAYMARLPAGEVSQPPSQKLFRTNLAAIPKYDYYFVYMKNLARQVLNLIIATTALGFGLAVGAPAQDPGGRYVPAALQRQSVCDTSHQERTTLMQTAKRSPDVKIPPLDAAVPAHMETATFGLG
jgi:hypothetical protein